MEWLIAVGGVLALWIVRAVRSGNLQFWRAVHERPELGLMWMALHEKDWLLDEHTPGPGWAGPFQVALAPHGITRVWARDDALAPSQAAFLALLRAMTEEEKQAAATAFRSKAAARQPGGGIGCRVTIGDLIPQRLRECSAPPPTPQSNQDNNRSATAEPADSGRESVDSIRTRARTGCHPLTTAVRQLMPYFTLRVLPGRSKVTGSARIACAKWIMLEDDGAFATDAPRRDRSRLLDAWEGEIRQDKPCLQSASSTAPPHRPAPRTSSAAAESHCRRVDTWRQQVRDGEQSQVLLHELLQDFTIRIMHDLAADGSFADVASCPDGDQLLDRFWDWLHDEPIDGPTEPRLRWRPTAK